MRPIVISRLSIFSISAFSVCVFALQATAAESDEPQAPLMQPELSGHPPLPTLPNGQPAPSRAAAPADQMATGTVLETMDSGGYTYVRVKVEGEDRWAAGPQVAVKVGNTVSFSKGMEMKAFRSDSLQRTFDSVYFVDAIQVGAENSAPAASVASPHGSVGSAPPAEIDLSGITPADGGKTVKSVYEEKASLSGQQVIVRAKVVKANLGIMGKNWFHLRDGTATADGNNDLTITSMDTAAVGDLVLVRGNVATDKDFGFGYRYNLMIEDAKITRE